MNDAKLVHPELEQLSAFAQGRLGEAELSEIHAHLSDCAECRDKVEASGDDTLVSLLRAADTNPISQEKLNPPEAVTVAATASGGRQPPVDLPADLAQHGRYRVQELLGVGGMGAVYKAEHLLMERPVALKLISHSLTSNPAMIERFRREVKAAGHLKHANIVMAYDAEQAGDSHFLVMEYVEGKSLSRVVADQGPLPVREACEYIRQAAVGLQYAHERGMVHRDIKPQNLMLTPDGQVKILDFGLARFAMEAAPAGALLAAAPTDVPVASGDTATKSLTQAGTVMGTPDYIAPEQANDAHTADIRADIYSLGCTLYDLLAGHAPFADGTVMTKVMAHIERMPQPLSAVRKDVPPELARVVERMMAKDPARRFQTPAEVATALTRFATPVTRSRGRRIGAFAAAAVLIAVMGITGYLYGATIYRIVTNQGELIVEVAGPEVEIVLKKSTITVEDRVANRKYDVNIGPNLLKSGTFELHVTDAAGLNLFTKQFTIARNGQTSVKVTFQPKDDMAVQAAKVEAASKATEAWLKLVDAGDLAQAWDQAAESLRKLISKKDFASVSEPIYKKLGKLKTRVVAKPRPQTVAAGALAGEYVVIENTASYENWPNVVETLVAMLGPDGRWRVSQSLIDYRAVPPDAQEFALVVRAGRGQLSKQEQEQLANGKLNPALADMLAEPRQKTLLELFANLPDGAHKHLLKEGYLKWRFSAFDAGRQKTLGEAYQLSLDQAKKLGKEVPATLSMAAFEKADLGLALVNVLGLKQSVVSWFLLFPADPQPYWVPVVGPKMDDIPAWAAGHEREASALRGKGYSKGIELFAKADVASDPAATPRDEDRLQGTWKGVAGFAMGQRIKDEDARQVIVKFVGDTMDTPPSPGNKGGKGIFKLDPSKTPKQIKATAKEGGKVIEMKGIYSLDGDTLRICMSAPEHGEIKEFGGKIGLDITLRREARRNPFGVPDVENPDDDEVKAFAARRNLPGDAKDANAEEWATQPTKGDKDSLDGEWFGRQKDKDSDWEYCKGHVQIKSVGERVYILFTDHEGQWLADTRREKNRLVGRLQGVDKRRDWNGPCYFVIASPERLDGEVDNDRGGRLDFRRKLAQVDRDLLQGTWKPVSGSVQGQQIPDLLFMAVGPTIRFDGNKVTWKANPPGKDLAGSPLARFNLDGVFDLDQTQSPRTINMTVLGKDPKTPLGTPAPRALLGIYKLQGDTLELCIAIDPDHPEERPTKFESAPGKFIVHMTLTRLSGAQLPGAPKGTFALPKGGDGAAWALTLDGKDRFTITRNGQFGVEGTYKINRDEIEFTDQAGPQREEVDRRSGTYRWRLAGEALMFELVKDKARGRTATLLGGAWIRTADSAGPAGSAKGKLINTFGTGFQPITRDGVNEDQGVWRIDNIGDRVVRLYEVQPPLEDCLVTYRAKIKPFDLQGKAYLEMYCRFSSGGEFHSRGLMNAVSAKETKDWVTVEIPFVLQKDERPDLLKLNVHVEGSGMFWIKDIELWQAPLAPEMRRPSKLTPAAGFTPGIVKRFGQTDKLISDHVTPDQNGWRHTGNGETIRLFEVKDFKDDSCMATYRAQLKSSGLKGQAYLEMLVHLAGDPDDQESFSRGLAMPLPGTSDWASYETPFRLEKGQRPDRIRLNLVIQGEGSVWIRDIELLRGPLVK